MPSGSRSGEEAGDSCGGVDSPIEPFAGRTEAEAPAGSEPLTACSVTVAVGTMVASGGQPGAKVAGVEGSGAGTGGGGAAANGGGENGIGAVSGIGWPGAKCSACSDAGAW